MHMLVINSDDSMKPFSFKLHAKYNIKWQFNRFAKTKAMHYKAYLQHKEIHWYLAYASAGSFN